MARLLASRMMAEDQAPRRIGYEAWSIGPSAGTTKTDGTLGMEGTGIFDIGLRYVRIWTMGVGSQDHVAGEPQAEASRRQRPCQSPSLTGKMCGVVERQMKSFLVLEIQANFRG